MNARHHAETARFWVQAGNKTALSNHRSARWRRRMEAEELLLARTHALVALALAATESEAEESK
jgi:hypothetical protein